MTHTARDGASAPASSASEAAPRAPAAATARTASAFTSQATTEWPPWSRRVTMLLPIRPSPTKPSCITWPPA